MKNEFVLSALIAACACLIATSPVAAGPCDPYWDNGIGDPGVNSTVYSLLEVDAASPLGPALYAGGQFSTAGGSTAKNIVKWDGISWSPLGTGAENGGIVYALALSTNGVLYAGGAFGNMAGLPDTAKIAQWDGNAWSDVGGSLPSSNAGVRALTFFQGDLYAGGYLSEVGGVTAHKIARFDGANWFALPGDPLSSTSQVLALTVNNYGDGESLYIGGSFENAGGDANADYVFRFDGSSYASLGQGANNDVKAMAVYDGDLYIGGEFTRVYQADGTEVIANKIARWDGTMWHAVGSGMDAGSGYYIWALNTFDDGNGEALYAGGSFSSPANKIARWDGAHWSPVGTGSGPNGYIYAMETSAALGGSSLVVGGTFSTFNGSTAQHLAEWRSAAPAAPTDALAYPAEICAGTSADLTASASGATIDWYTDGCGATFVGSGGLISVSPATTTTYYARARTAAGCESATCAELTVVIGSGPIISAQPSGADICPGDSHQLCVTATRIGELDYQWEIDSVDIPGANAACYDATTSGTYRCYVTDDCQKVASDPAIVTVEPGVIFSAQPEGGALCPAVSTQLICVAASGSGPLHYQWRRNGLTLIGATAECYDAATAGSYTCIVSDDCGPVESDAAHYVLAVPSEGDFDGSGVTDAADYALLAGCLDGPATTLSGGCECVDVTGDGRIDLVDFAAFAIAFDQ